MRHISINELLQEIFATPEGKRLRKTLFTAHKKVAAKDPDQRQGYIKNNGASKWTPLKNKLTLIVGNKCWYTEVELVGGPLAVDHYRPVCNYWWLAFDAVNFRVACPYANSPKHNPLYGCAGGKGDEFPLLGPAGRAGGRNKLKTERPSILDPCNSRDCEMVAFQADGRPVIHPNYSSDRVALERLEKSKILLNLDHPDFNTKREQLYHDISNDVKEYEEPATSALSRARIFDRMERRLLSTASFSTAARFYLQFHREHVWVNWLL